MRTLPNLFFGYLTRVTIIKIHPARCDKPQMVDKADEKILVVPSFSPLPKILAIAGSIIIAASGIAKVQKSEMTQ